MTVRNGFKSSTGVVYYLLGEGPISLKNGLASIYLDRTPIINADIVGKAEAREMELKINSDGEIELGTTQIDFNQTYIPVLIYKGHRTTTGNMTAGSPNLTTAVDSFFRDDRMVSQFPAGFRPKVTVEGAGIKGTDLVADQIDYTTGDNGTLSKAAETSVTNAVVHYDLFTYATVQTSTVIPFPGVNITSKKLVLDTPTNLTKRDTTLRGIIGGALSEQGSASNDTNFDFVRVNYRGGQLKQELPNVISDISAATNGITPGVEINQVDYTRDSAGNDTVAIWGNKLNPWWTKDNVSTSDDVFSPQSGSQATAPTTITATGSGSLGLNLSNPSEVDEVRLNIACPEGLYGGKQGNDERTNAGAAFQVFLEVKDNPTAAWQSFLSSGGTLA